MFKSVGKPIRQGTRTLTPRTRILVDSPQETGELEHWKVEVREVRERFVARPVYHEVQAELVEITVPERYHSDRGLVPAHRVALPGDGSEPYVPTARVFIHKEPACVPGLAEARDRARQLAGVLSRQLEPRFLEESN